MGSSSEPTALFAVDVVGTAGPPTRDRERRRGALIAMLSSALADLRIAPDEVRWHDQTEQGALFTFPGSRLGAVLDLAEQLDLLVADHNRRANPNVQLRMSVDHRALAARPGSDLTDLRVNRLLRATAFIAVLDRHLGANPRHPVRSALIVSHAAFRHAFAAAGGTSLNPADFTELPLTGSTPGETAWIRLSTVGRECVCRL
jgi:hypothetical protein